MNIITVIPVTRSKINEELTYFTASEIPIGAVVSVPLRSKNINAVVTASEPAQNLKTNIKSASFEIRKLGKVKAKTFFPETFIESCRTLADYYATSVGAVIRAIVSNSILENISKIKPPLALSPIPNKDTPPKTHISEIFAVQGDDMDRLSSWRSMIRQEFARKKSLVIYIPTTEDAKQIFKTLEKGIEEYIFLLHNGMTNKSIVNVWQAIARSKHPVVIIANGGFSLLPREDIESVIIERENTRGWIDQRAPYIDARQALCALARARAQKVYIADNILRTETLAKIENHEISEGSPFKWRSISTAKEQLIDMRKPDVPINTIEKYPIETVRPNFQVFSPELESLILQNKKDSTHLFLLAIRRGISPVTVCGDCQTIVSCTQCSSPVVLHVSTETGRNFFMCHKCGARRSADENCAVCDGWRLTPLGIGIDRVWNELIENFPDIDIFKIDSDTTRSDEAISMALDKFRARPGSILVGTELGLSRLSEKIEHVAVVSLDSLFALPDFRIQERVMYMLIRLRSLATRTMLVQTRRPQETAFEYGLKGNLSDFHRTIMEERKRFSYPPFSTLIKITMEGKKEMIASEMSRIQILLEPLELDIFPAFTSTVRGDAIIHGLIRLPPHSWPDDALSTKLRSLPQGIKVKVDPETLL